MLSVLLFAVGALSKGEITIQNHPRGVLWCGQQLTLSLGYSSADVPDGSELTVELMQNVLAFANKPIAVLGKLTAPAKQFAVVLNSPLPAELLASGLLGNDGLQQQVLFRVKRSDNDDVNSSCKGICNDPTMSLICCPPENSERCGCLACSCANNDVCGMGLYCDYTKARGVCQTPPPTLGEACPAGKCAAPLLCACPIEVGVNCAASQKTCQDDACPKPTAGVPGRLGCPCAPDGMCQPGAECLKYFCHVSTKIPIGQLSCAPAQAFALKGSDACMSHPDGSMPASPYSCQSGRCAKCTPGDRLCICNNSACANPGDVCEGGRCFARQGCEGCACVAPELTCTAPGTVCISNECRRVQTPAPPTPLPPTPAPTLAPTPAPKSNDGSALCVTAAWVALATMTRM